MTTLQQRQRSGTLRWHHPRVHQRDDGWAWECRCGAAGRAGDTDGWRLTFVAARVHAHHATR